jgi:outer membrane receptor protein involved in Fe transport
MSYTRFLKLTPIAFAVLTALPAMAQTNTDQAATEQEAGEIEEVIVTGSQIKGAAINDALSVSVIDVQAIEDFGIESGDELLDVIPEQGQNFFNEAENIAGGVNSARGDVGAFNLRNIGTGNTLVLLNGRRVVNSATFQTEEVGGSFVPVNTANSAAIPVFGLERLEILRDGASAIYGADAVAGVANTVMKNDYEGLTVRARYTTYDNIPRDDASVTIEWGDLFNEGRTAAGVFVNFYTRDRVNSQDDPKWADSDYRRLVPEDSPWFGDTAFRNDSANSNWGQFDIVRSMSGDPFGLVARRIVDTAGEFETYPFGDERCGPDSYVIADNVCGNRDGQGTYRYNLNQNRDVVSELDRFNSYAYLNHDFDNGIEAYTEFSWYQSSSNLIRHPSTILTGFNMRVSADNYYNPLGPCGSPNRLPESVIGPDVPCEGLELIIDNYRWAEVPRIVDHDATSYRILQGFRGSFGGLWDWDGAILYSKEERDETTRNRVSNTLLAEALADPTSAAYNPWGAGDAGRTNIERALVDVYRNNEADLALIDFKVSNPALFKIWGGREVGFLAGAEYREESFKDDRDPRLDGTIVYTHYDGTTFPYASDVLNSSPTADNSGSRDVTSLFTEFAVPLLDTLDLQFALRYENFSDVGSTTVPKVAFGWRPTEWFLLRGSWSEAFRAPNLITVNESLVVRNNTNDDWLCRYAQDNSPLPEAQDLNCNYSMQRRARGSEDLEPEKSDNSSIGVVLNPIDNLTFTIDFWKIEKKDTIGLFGEENHTLLDLLFYLEAGNASCAGVGNPAVGRVAADDDEIAIFESVGLCPAGRADYIDDNYANLDTRIVEGFDFGLYFDLPTDFGDWNFTWQGSITTRYKQEPGNRAAALLEAQEAGMIPANYPVRGFDDLLRRDGNQEQKMNARLNWRLNDWGASLAWFYLSDFYQSSLTRADGSRWVIPSHSTWNASVDYRFDLFGSRTLARLGVRNLTNERAPLADRYFGYFSDAHSDLGRSYYLDVRLSW